MYFRKFYDSDPVEGGASAVAEPASIAEMMAKEGKMSHNESPVIPTVTRNEPAEAQAAEATPVETTTVADKIEQNAVTDTPSEGSNSQSWKEVLRQQNPEEILRELGYDENSVSFVKELKELDPKMVKFLDTWKNNGDALQDYLKEAATDYATMPSEDVMRHQLREEYPKASEKQLEILFRKEVIEKYNLDSMDDDLVEEGKMLLDAKVERFREKLVDRQKDTLLPEYNNSGANEIEQRAKQEFDAYKSTMLSSDMAKDLMSNKRLTISEGDDKFNYAVANPDSVLNNLFDSNAWSSKLFDIKVDATGNEQFVPNVEKQLLISAILEDHKGFLREMAKHYKSLGGKATIDSLDNPKPTGNVTPSKSQGEPKTPAEFMAKFGRLV
jgi:hypothetical protein